MDTRDGRIYRSIEEFDGPKDEYRFLKPMAVPPTEYQLRKMKVGRNDPCPCGSKMKFKKCCMFRVANGEGLKANAQ